MIASNHRTHIWKIRNDFQASQRVKDSLNNSIQALARDLYSKDTHFIFELIQNAEDNAYDTAEPSLSFRLVKTDPTGTQGSDGVLIVQNNEIGFSSENVEAICAVGKTTKSKIQGYIGEKGIGFKSVFRITSDPHIFSNGYSFCMPEHDEETGLGYIVPQWIEQVPAGIDPSKTTIILPLDKTDFGYGKIEKMLRDIEPEAILFLSKLKEIKIETDTGDSLTILKDDLNVPHVQILVEGIRQGESFSNVDEFLLYTKPFDKPPDIFHEKRHGIDKRDGSIAFPLNEDNKSAGKIFAYLPVRSDTGLPFLINADFILPSSREEILDIPWNRWLMGCVANLVAHALPCLKEKGLLTVALLEALASRMKELSENSIFYPIVRAVRDAFMNEELLPADDGTFVSAHSAKLSRGSELRKLLNPDQLRSLFHSKHDIKWLSGRITGDLTYNLRLYLMEQLKIEEVRPGRFAELLTDEFLEKQGDKWVIDFYSFLGGKDRSKLWKKPDAALRKRKILRLENDFHVVPFKNDGTPNAYRPSSAKTNFPTIKRSIFADESAADFLKSLGIIEPGLFAEIMEFTLPKYAEDRVVVDHDENIDDLKKIEKLLNEPSQGSSSSSLAKLRILLGKLGLAGIEDYFSNIEPRNLIPNLLKIVLPSIRFLRSYNGRKTEYKAPKDIYNNSPELHCYFQDNSEAWFICDDYPDELISLFNALGINQKPKITKKNPDKNGFVIISKSHSNHRRGLNKFDPDIKVDGLENAVSNPTIERSVFIWNNITVPHSACIRGVVEKSSRKTYENSSKERQVSGFGRLLMASAWLPSPNKGFVKPSELSLDDLPIEFEKDIPRAKSLSLAMRMKQPEHEQALEVVTEGDPDLKMLIEHYQSASDAERKKILKSIPSEHPLEQAPSFKEGLKKLGRPQRGTTQHGGTEGSPVSDTDRYQDKLNGDVEQEVAKYQSTSQIISFSPVRDRSMNAEARDFLYEQYHGRCQLTGTTFPKASRNINGVSENYFESCALLSYTNAGYLNDAGNMLCVSADTMAKFRCASIEFLDSLEDTIESFKLNSGKLDKVSVRIRLAGEECSIKWTERHFMRLIALYEKA